MCCVSTNNPLVAQQDDKMRREGVSQMMNSITEPERKIPVIADVDVVVCGAGVAGVTAAVCAARNGADVLLIERYGFLGGMATAGLVITTPPLNNGINVEIARKFIDRGLYRRCMNAGDDPAQSNLTALDPEVLKYDLQRMVVEHNVKILLHTYIVQSIVEDSVIKGVIIENKGGRQAILGRVVIDTTGDGDVAASAGAPYETADNPLPLTLMFNMVGVDIEKALSQIGHWGNLRRVVEEAINRGELSYDLGRDPSRWAPGLYGANLCYLDEINVWTGNLYGRDPLDPNELTEAEIVSRDHAMKLAHFLKGNVRGFEGSRIEYTATQVGIRETRRIQGTIAPSLSEVKNTRFPDTVAKPYVQADLRVPYRSLVPKNIDNLLVAGRCISAQQDAMVQLRLIPPCVVTGQAVGTAAALALKEHVTPRKLDVSLIQKTVTGQGMDLAL